MNISKAIRELEKIKETHGDLEVTVTACLLDDGWSKDDGPIKDVFESTLENLFVNKSDDSLGPRVRLSF